MLVRTFGSAVYGVEAITITIEVNISRGINFAIVGLPDNAVKESQQRLRAALENIHYKIPGKAITINMAPADIRKEGSAYDLPMAVGILACSNQIKTHKIEEYVLMGEIALNGEVRGIKGALPIAVQAKNEGFTGLILPRENANEAAIVEGLKVYGVTHISEVIAFFNEENTPPEFKITFADELIHHQNKYSDDFSDVRGQENIKRAFEIAAAGGHNIILIGPPGSGKTMLAKRLSSILPPMSLTEALETTKIYSVAGQTKNNHTIIANRPFRSPHHTISDVALVGGGNYPQPGEISLSHNGVLFLDELPEFKRSVLEVMRQPLEDRKVSVSRARFSVEYPSGFMLVAAMNPCPCGYFNHPEKDCVCAPGVVQKYLNKISGPLLDRIDIHIEVTPVAFERLSEKAEGEKSEAIRLRVTRARERQGLRYIDNDHLHCNAQMDHAELKKHSKIDPVGQQLLKQAMSRLNLSARAYDRILKVARTIADLDGADSIQSSHLAEAIQYRSLDRENWINP